MNKLALITLISSVSLAPFAAFAAEETAPKAAEPVVASEAAPAVKEAAKETVKEATKEVVKPVLGELKDGTKIETLGEKVEFIGKDGKKTPATDGEHILKDGSKLITKGGMIVKK